jgi:GTP 3',8-cyclase
MGQLRVSAAIPPRLVDGYGRVHTDLRLSLTDRCNLRCSYCMPAEGVPWLPGPHLLSATELTRLVGLAADQGIRSVRLTGGEPLLRADLVDVVAALAAQQPSLELSMTTNGMRLADLAAPLAAAGLRRVNVSMDTLRPDRFRAITRRDGLESVLAGIDAAIAAGLHPVKVNAVLMRGINDDEAPELLAWALQRGVGLRFIEQMPLDGGGQWRREEMVTSEEAMRTLAGYVLSELPRDPADPAQLFGVGESGSQGTVGFVSSVSAPFCGGCDRLRLTADGQLRNCLFAMTETDLRTPLRDGADDAELTALIFAAVAAKLPGHGIDDPAFIQPQRPMSAIGG